MYEKHTIHQAMYDYSSNTTVIDYNGIHELMFIHIMHATIQHKSKFKKLTQLATHNHNNGSNTT